MFQFIEEKVRMDKSKKWGELLFFITFSGLIFLMSLNSTTYIYEFKVEYLYYTELVLSILATIKAIFFNRYKSLTSFSLVIFVGLFLWSCAINARSWDIIYYYTLIVAAKGIDYHKILKYFTIILTISVLFTILSAKLGIIIGLVNYRGGDSPVIRYALGTLYPSNIAARIAYIWLAYTVIRKFNYAISDYIIGILLMVLSYVVTDTKNSMIMMIMTIILVLGKKYVVSLIKWLGIKVIMLISSVGIAMYVCSSYIYNSKNIFLELVNKVLTHRLQYGHEAFERYNVSLFGQQIWEHGNGGLHPAKGDYFYIDSSYVRVLMYFGIFVFLLLVGTLIYLQYQYFIINSYSLLVALILIMVSVLIDPQLTDMTYNFIFLGLLANLGKFENDIGTSFVKERKIGVK